MQIDFHYYATYCAAILAGYSHEESLEICYSAQFVDCCSVSLLSGAGAPLAAATTQLQLEMVNARTDILGLQDITRIWASFHFLPYDLKADVQKAGKTVKQQIEFTAPKKTGKYSKSWAIKKTRETSDSIQIVVHSKRYQLTHLLEFGHAKRGGGRTRAFPHIAPAEQAGIEQLTRDIERDLQKGG